jgi:hypothetical protein
MSAKKEIRKQLKNLEQYALPNTFKVTTKKHMKISMRAKDADGVIKKLTFILGLSPSDVNWVKQFERQKRKYLMQHNICPA